MIRVVQSVPVGGASLCKTWKGVRNILFYDEYCFEQTLMTKRYIFYYRIKIIPDTWHQILVYMLCNICGKYCLKE